MQITGWGKYPVIDSEQIIPRAESRLKSLLEAEGSFAGIARGMGRSYGDSSLAPQTISTLQFNHLLDFDADNGTIRCRSGVTLADLLEVLVPRGWFLPVTPVSARHGKINEDPVVFALKDRVSLMTFTSCGLVILAAKYPSF